MACMQIVLDKGQQYNWFDTDWICYLSGICIFLLYFSMYGNLNTKIQLLILGFLKIETFYSER